MPRVSTGRQSSSLAKPSVYRIPRGEDWDRLNSIAQHSLTTKLSDGSQGDTTRVSIVVATENGPTLKPPKSVLTTKPLEKATDTGTGGDNPYTPGTPQYAEMQNALDWNAYVSRFRSGRDVYTITNPQPYVPPAANELPPPRIVYVPKPWTGRGGPRED